MGARHLPLTDYLTSGGDQEIDRAAKRTWCGQAHFAVGPTTCSSCEFWGYSQVLRDAAGNSVGTQQRKGACRRFYELTGEHGPGVPGHAWACRHYQKRKG